MNRTFLHRLLGAVRRWHDSRLAIHALSALDDRLLRDIGIDRSQVVRVVDGRMSGASFEPDRRGHTTLPAEAPRPQAKPYSARPEAIHGPAARHWPQAFQRAAGANDETSPAAGKGVEQTC